MTSVHRETPSDQHHTATRFSRHTVPPALRTAGRRLPTTRRLHGPWLAALCIAAASCSKSAQNSPPKEPTVRERPTAQTAPAHTRPAQTRPTQPQAARPHAPEPETRPSDALPPSRYDSKPPYPVELHVRDPREEQPGWLRILKLDDPDLPAGLQGKFPEQNLMIVDTQNVKRIDIHIGHLPLAPGRRIILRIDGNGMELRRGKGQFITLERTATGAWTRIADH